MAYLLSFEALRAIVADAPEEHPVKRWRRQAAREGVRDEEIFTSVVAIGILEDLLLRFDPADPAAREAFQNAIRVTLPRVFGNRILDVDELVSRQWGRLRNMRDSAERLVASETLLIIATALRNGMIYVGRRAAWMEPLNRLGLTVIDPWVLYPPPAP